MENTKDERPRTVWFGGTASSRQTATATTSDPAGEDSPRPLAAPTTLLERHSGLSRGNGYRHLATARDAVNQDPWVVYEARADVNYGRNVTLARHRVRKMDIIHVQRLSIDQPKAHALVRLVDQSIHHSFPRLLEYYHQGDDFFLVWEPAELSVNEILTSNWRIEKAELAQIVWPILRGIKFLQDRGRALAALSPEKILLTDTGGVKIVGVETSCELEPPDMNAATLKLTALAAIVDDLMRQNGKNAPWSSDATRLCRSLTEQPLDKLLRDPFFEEMGGEGSLKLLVTIVNRTAHHNIKLLDSVL